MLLIHDEQTYLQLRGDRQLLLHGLYHINIDVNVVWMCCPQFDSSFIFGSLLDSEKGGGFSVSPHGIKSQSMQRYIENSSVLSTEFETSEGRYRVIDFAPRFSQYGRYFKPQMLIRKIEPLSGSPGVKVKCRPKAMCGETAPEIMHESSHIRYSGFDQQLRLTSNIPLNFITEETEFVLNETKYLVLTYAHLKRLSKKQRKIF